jgi:hypothetical protein
MTADLEKSTWDEQHDERRVVRLGESFDTRGRHGR